MASKEVIKRNLEHRAHRAGDGRGHRRRAGVSRARVSRRARPEGPRGQRSAAGAPARGDDRAAGTRGPRGRARQGHRAPRHEAGERLRGASTR